MRDLFHLFLFRSAGCAAFTGHPTKHHWIWVSKCKRSDWCLRRNVQAAVLLESFVATSSLASHVSVKPPFSYESRVSDPTVG